MKHSSSELSAGLIVRSTKIWRWQSALVKALVNTGLISVVEVHIQGDELPALPKSIARLHKLDSIIFKSPMLAYELVEFDHPPERTSNACKAQCNSANNNSIDFWINLSERSVDEALYKSARIGLLETHFSEPGRAEVLSSVNFGYSEFARSEKQCYFSIVAHVADNPSLVLSSSRPSMDSGPLSRNMNQYWRLLESSWVRVCKSLQTKNIEQIIYKNSNVKKVLGSVDSAPKPERAYHNLSNIFLNKFSQKFFRKEQWVLLLQFQNQSDDLKKEMPLSFVDYVEISPPEDCFWADPFVVTENERHYVFFEELPYATERGHLSCMEVFRDGTHTVPKIILKKPYHLSYPNVFRYESQYYMIPESGDTGSISLYRSTNFPYQWEHKFNLMENIHAYDSTLIEHEGLWWLFACIAPEKGMSGNEELNIFYADTPLSQEWQSHTLNPIISDASCARPAGKFFEWQGSFYRPSQDCAGSYGAGLNINKIKVLNKQAYTEELVHCSRPTWDPKLTALHTLNFNQHVSVADAMRVDRRFF